MIDSAVVCVKCGVAAGQGSNFCPNCGAQTVPGAAVCTTCGSALTVAVPGEQKSKLVAGLLGILLGSLGVHNFYTSKAVAQLLISVLSCGILAFASGIWGLIEGIMILTGNINKDGKGVPLKD